MATKKGSRRSSTDTVLAELRRFGLKYPKAHTIHGDQELDLIRRFILAGY